MTAKHMVSQNTRKSCCLVKSMNVFEKEKKDCVFFLSSNLRQKKGRKHLAVNRQQTSIRAAKVLFTTENGYEKSKNMNANRIRVKSSRFK